MQTIDHIMRGGS